MIDLSCRLEEFLRIRRSLGFKLTRDGKLLAQFIGYLHERGTDTITTDHAVVVCEGTNGHVVGLP